MRTPRRAYSWRDPDDYPSGHPVGMTNPNHIGTITITYLARIHYGYATGTIGNAERTYLPRFIPRCH